jgi:hypothetical protein
LSRSTKESGLSRKKEEEEEEEQQKYRILIAKKEAFMNKLRFLRLNNSLFKFIETF